VSSTQHHTAET